MSIKAIAFDIDGTLYRESDLYLHMAGKAVGRARFLLAFNRIRHELRSLIKEESFVENHPTGIESFHRFQAGLVARSLGVDTDTAYGAIEEFFYEAAVEVFSNIRLYRGVPELLARFRGLGLKLGALSDFPCERKLDLLGLGDEFDVAMTSEETGLVKPHRAPFDLLSSRLGVSSDEILYVGNSEAYDVAGSLAAGMRAALITHRKSAAKATAAEFAFRDYADLGRYVAAHLN